MLYDKKWDKPAEVKLEPWRKHLLDAAQYIRDHGWCQGTTLNDKGEVCALGALRMVTNWHGPGGTQIQEAHIQLQNLIGGSIPYWNDHSYRTKEDVIAAFENAAR